MPRKQTHSKYPLDVQGRTSILNLKGSVEEREWFEMVTKRTMISGAKIARAALKDWARKNKLPLPPWPEGD